MSELFPSDVELSNLSGTSDTEQEVPYIAIGQTPYYTSFYKMLYRLLDMARRAGDLRVYKDGVLTFGVRSGKFADGDSIIAFGGASSQLLTNNATNYIYILADGTLAINTSGFPTPSQTPHIRLATITTSGGAYSHANIIDCRGSAIMNVLSAMNSTGAAEASQFFSQTDFNAEQANQLISGQQADTLHIHNLENVADGTTRKAIDVGEKSALAGTAGTPGEANRFVTDSDLRMSDAREPDFSAIESTDAFADGDLVAAQRGTQAVMVSSDAIMSPIDWASGSGSENPKKVDHSVYAETASQADNAVTLCGYGVGVNGPSPNNIVPTREDTGKFDSNWLDLSGAAGNIDVLSNGSGGLVIDFGTAASFDGNVNISGSQSISGSLSLGGHLDMSVGRIGCNGYAYILGGLMATPYSIYFSQSTSFAGTSQPDALRINSYGTNGTAIFYHFDTTGNRQYQAFNRNGTLQVQPITSISPLTTSTRGIMLASGSTTSYIQTAQVGAKVRVLVDSTSQTYILDKIGEWRDAENNVI